MKTAYITLTYLVVMDVEEDEDLMSVEQAARDMVETDEWRPNDVEIEVE
jgi:diphthamide biosynthesis methyltransferase